ncbi:DUF2062 domain-containing protein [Marinospirillum sp.]|uniref:DUF2062 domain-containing protein n=1 Tax=Marinospirillum sp. TaxID=2183934 RepID=UPI00287022C3|nr:DUF2062 domain-containing protein [Marinospirillum sp.]MDR9468395.1 DUF2062 domain-containing protein [Marinospirillum sp.]
MPRKFFKRYLPKPEKLRGQKSLGFLSEHLADPSLWTLTRRSVGGAFSIGLFFAFIPMPFQMIAAAFLAILFRVNLPIAVGLVWVSNPVTMPGMFYVSYLLGSWLMDVPLQPPDTDGMLEWVINRFGQIWQPLLLGSVLLGAMASLLSNIGVRLAWRWYVSMQWKRRMRMKRLPPPPQTDSGAK